MYRPFQTVANPTDRACLLRRRRYGVIEMQEGRLVGIHLRPWPKLISLPEVWWLGGWSHSHLQGDRCWLFYNQPWPCPNFLAVPYIVAGRRGSLASLHGATLVLDEIARIKRTDAIVCDVSNSRISDRLLRRWGWERHVPHSRRRHFIKRFYGEYRDTAAALVRYVAGRTTAAPEIASAVPT